MANKRSSNLPNARLQLKLVLSFLALGLTCLLAQYSFSIYALSELLAGFPGQTPEFRGLLNDLMVRQLVAASCVMIPLFLSVGILMTFKIAGPLVRIEGYLRQISKGETPGPLTLRAGDDLGNIADAVNAAVDRLQQPESAEESAEEPASTR